MQESQNCWIGGGLVLLVIGENQKFKYSYLVFVFWVVIYVQRCYCMKCPTVSCEVCAGDFLEISGNKIQYPECRIRHIQISVKLPVAGESVTPHTTHNTPPPGARHTVCSGFHGWIIPVFLCLTIVKRCHTAIPSILQSSLR